MRSRFSGLGASKRLGYSTPWVSAAFRRKPPYSPNSCEATRASRGPSAGVREDLRADVGFPGGRRFTAEIADTPERLERGYMYRREIGPNDGMLFIFSEPGIHSFWMKNTLVPLDIIWMNESFEVVHIQHATPPCVADPCPSYGPMSRVSYVLEVRGGTVRGERLQVGDRLQITIPELPC